MFKQKKIINIILIIFILFTITGCSNNIKAENENFANIFFNNISKDKKTDINLIDLILVNKENKLPDDYDPDLIDFENFKIAAVLEENLTELKNAAKDEDIYIYINCAYRSNSEQEQVYINTVANFVDNGNSYDIAVEKAKQIAALPGYSEHQTGLAIDFTNGGTYEEKEELWNWLSLNAYKYGFILRYPQGKEDITGYDYEAWHYRYVGKKDAKKMFDENLCLEEYLNNYIVKQ